MNRTQIEPRRCGNPIRGIVVACLLIAGGCQAPGNTPAPEPAPDPAPPAVPAEPVAEANPQLNDRERFGEAIKLLEVGKADQAAAELRRYLEVYPGSRPARELLGQIETPIDEYFPSESFDVELASGESISTIARDYLGDALLFYVLARYNGVEANPKLVKAGQTLRIPATADALAARDRAASGVAAPGDTVTDAESPEAADSNPTQQYTEAELATRELNAALVEGDLEAAYEAAQRAHAAQDDADTAAALDDVRQQLADSYYREAVAAFRAQDLKVTIAKCEQVLELDPEHDNARLYKAQAEELLERLDQLNQG